MWHIKTADHNKKDTFSKATIKLSLAVAKGLSTARLLK
jgi:hypothetical protein